MPEITWKKVARLVLTLTVLIVGLACLSAFFLLTIQNFVIENTRDLNLSLPLQSTQLEGNYDFDFWTNVWREGKGPEKRAVVIDLQQEIATVDFSFAIGRDHPAADYVLTQLRRAEPRVVIESMFGELSFDNSSDYLDNADFQPVSLTIDTQTNLITVHYLANRTLDKTASVRLNRLSNTLPVVPLSDEVIVNYAGRSLNLIYPYPSEASDGMIKIVATSPDKIDALVLESNLVQAQPTIFSELFSRQKLLQRVGDVLDVPFLSPMLSSILEVLPLLIFLAIIWQSKEKLPRSLAVVRELVLLLLTFHFSYYLVSAVTNAFYRIYDGLSLYRFNQQLADALVNLYSRIFNTYPSAAFPEIPLGITSIGTIVVGILLPAMFVRRIEEWVVFRKDEEIQIDPFRVAHQENITKKPATFWLLFTYLVLFLLVEFPLYYYLFLYNPEFLNNTKNYGLVLITSFLIGIFGILLMLMLRALYVRLDGKPIPGLTIQVAFWMIFMGNLIWSITRSVQINLQRNLELQTGWGWLIYSTILGAILVYGFARTVYALLEHAGRVPNLDKRTDNILKILSILTAIPMRLLYAGSTVPADYYEVLSLAGQLDNLIKFIFLSGLVWYFYEAGKESPALNPLSLTMGMLATATILYPSGLHWLYIPLTFIIGYRLLSNLFHEWKIWLDLKPLFRRVFTKRQDFLEEIVRLNQAENAYQELFKTTSAKLGSGDITYATYRNRLEKRRKELDSSNKKAQVGGNPIKDIALTFGPKATAWENGRHGATWAALFALPWMSIWVYNFMIGEAYTTSYPLWSFFGDLLNLLMNWLGIGFLFGYFYPFLRGKNGLQKGLRLWIIAVLPALPLAMIMYGTVTEWQGFLFWVLQLFLHCMLLGLIAFDYMTLRQGYRDWQMLFELHGIPSVGVSVSTILIAAGTAITTLLQTQTQEIVRIALTFILPNADKLIKPP